MSVNAAEVELKLEPVKEDQEHVLFGFIDHRKRSTRERTFEEIVRVVREIADGFHTDARSQRDSSTFTIVLECGKDKAREILAAIYERLTRLGHRPVTAVA